MDINFYSMVNKASMEDLKLMKREIDSVLEDRAHSTFRVNQKVEFTPLR